MCYEACPRQFRYRYVDKLPEPKSPAMDRGLEIHQTLETFVKAKRAPGLPLELKPILRQLSAFKKRGAVAEREVAFDRDWKPVGWFAREARVRAKIDLTVPLSPNRVFTIDYKTGRPNPEKHVEQMQLYGLMVLVIDTLVRFVEHGLWYVDHHREPHPTGVIERDPQDLKHALARWDARAARIFAERKWRTRPSKSTCKWCAFSKLKGGPCEDGM